MHKAQAKYRPQYRPGARRPQQAQAPFVIAKGVYDMALYIRKMATAQQAQDADGALDEIVGAIATISDTAVRIADVTAQQTGAVSEIRDHSERIHVLGDENLQRIGIARDQSQQLLTLGSELNTAVQAFRV